MSHILRLIAGLTAIEAWMLACILFVFGALVEYAAILFRKQTRRDKMDMVSYKSLFKSVKEWFLRISALY